MARRTVRQSSRGTRYEGSPLTLANMKAAWSGRHPSVAQVGKATGITFPVVHVDMDFEQVLQYKDRYKGETNVLLVGAGVSGELWADHCDSKTIVVAANSAIVPLADRADIFICTEGNGFDLPWYWTETKATRFVSYCNLKNSKRPDTTGIPVERSWHMAGFDPREYFNPTPIPQPTFNSPTNNLYTKYRTYIGCDRESQREWGLLKGPVCYPHLGEGKLQGKRGMAVGTVYVNALHLLAYMGVDKIRSTGFPFCMKEVCHWTEPKFKYVPSRWAPPECFMHVNEIPTMWHFALSAAYAKQIRPVFTKAGVKIKDYSKGLMDIKGIETLMDRINKAPEDVTL